MKARNLTPEQVGVLKGALGASLIFSVGVAIGAFFLHRKHEEELDKLEKDTAKTCLDFAAEHYERVLRRKKKADRDASSGNKEKIREAMSRQLPVIHNHIKYDRIVEYTIQHDTGYSYVILQKDQSLVRVSADEITLVEPEESVSKATPTGTRGAENTGYEATPEEWEALEKTIKQQCEEYERISKELAEKEAEFQKELDRLKSEIHAENELQNEVRKDCDDAPEYK